MPIEVESPEQMGYDTIRNNLSESSYTDAALGEFLAASPGETGSGLSGAPEGSGAGTIADLGNLLLCYGSHEGHPGLRELIAKGARGGGSGHGFGSGSSGLDDDSGSSISENNVLLTMGAAGALFIIATSLLEKGDELVVVHPNYATNLETPRAIGAVVRTIDLHFEEGFRLDPDKIRAAITPKTRYISVTHPHNPTGACLDDAQLKALAQIAEEKQLYVLVDETYRDMVFGEQLPLAAEYSPRLISISSLSKTYGLPGLRTGWIICRDAGLYETFLAAKEQMHICGPVLDEELAYRYLLHRDKHYPRIKADIKEKFNLVKTWIDAQDDWEWVEPRGGCVGFPRMRRPESIDIDQFYELLLKKFGTYVGPGHWFEMPRHYIRLGFGWPAKEQLKEGLAALTKAIKETKVG
jgi:aspartate/methionine/tyrosine aminotransferase